MLRLVLLSVLSLVSLALADDICFWFPNGMNKPHVFKNCTYGCCGTKTTSDPCCDKLTAGVIVGIVIGCIFFVVLIVVIAACARRRYVRQTVIYSSQPQSHCHEHTYRTF